jgi:hypothetical protein
MNGLLEVILSLWAAVVWATYKVLTIENSIVNVRYVRDFTDRYQLLSNQRLLEVHQTLATDIVVCRE